VGRRLCHDIVTGKYAPGSLLPTATEMCEAFSVSRTTLREAYSILIAKALIEARAKIGTRVRPRGDWSLLDSELLEAHLDTSANEDFVEQLFVLRQMVEPAAAALVATACSDAAFDRIADAYRRLDAVSVGDGDLVAADLDFHTAILAATGNRFLTAVGGMIRSFFERKINPNLPGAACSPAPALSHCQQVFEAMRDRAPELARERMALLLRDRREGLKRSRDSGAAR
jgi:DNA-binding FadR family transcriptional regulator